MVKTEVGVARAPDNSAQMIESMVTGRYSAEESTGGRDPEGVKPRQGTPSSAPETALELRERQRIDLGSCLKRTARGAFRRDAVRIL
jgi:hypothetical protein